MKFQESALCHSYLDPIVAKGGNGIEIGASAHNDFGIGNCLNVDFTDDESTIYKLEEIRLCGSAAKVDIVAFGDELPLDDDSVDFVINSHVFEHMPNPIKCLREWWRVTRNNGIIYCVVPLRDSCHADAIRPVVNLGHVVSDFLIDIDAESHELDEGHSTYGHYHTWDLWAFMRMIDFINEFFASMQRLNVNSIFKHDYPLVKFDVLETEERDSKVGNGFTCILKVIKS